LCRLKAASTPQVELVQPLIFFLLVADVGMDHFLVPPHRIDEVPARPEVLPHEVALPFPLHPRQMDRALALDEPDTCDTAYFGGIDTIMWT